MFDLNNNFFYARIPFLGSGTARNLAVTRYSIERINDG